MDATRPGIRTTTFGANGTTVTGTPNRATVTLYPDAPVSVSVMRVPPGESFIFAGMDHGEALRSCSIGLSTREAGDPGVRPGAYQLDSYDSLEALDALRAIPGVSYDQDEGSDFGTVTLTAEAIAALGAPVDATRR